MKKMVTIILFIMCLLSFGHMQEAKAENAEWIRSGDWIYYVKNDGAVLYRYDGEEDTVSIPSVIDGYIVKELGLNLFHGAHVSCAAIPSTVEKFSTYTFDSYSNMNGKKPVLMETINVDPDNEVYSSQDGVVYSKDKKTLICYPEGKKAESFRMLSGVEAIAQNAFHDNRIIKQIIFPDSLKVIRRGAFYGCESLMEIHLNEGVTDIESEAFRHCSSLTVITIPKTVKSIGSIVAIGADSLQLEAINVDPQNQYYTSEDGVLFDKNKTILYEFPEGKRTAFYTVPETVEIIKEMKNPYLEEVRLLSGIKTISKSAFYNAESLRKINLPDTLETIGQWAFQGCLNLEELTIPASVKSIGDAAFIVTLKKIIVQSKTCVFYPENSALPFQTIIYGYENSTAHHYAQSFGRTFVNLETEEEIVYVYDVNKLLALLPSPDEIIYGEPAYPGTTYESVEGELLGYAPNIIHEYDTSREEYQNLKNFTDNLVKDCITDRQKIETISDWVHENITYVLGAVSGNTIDSVYNIFKRRYGNCMCFTQLTDYMLYLEGIPSASIITRSHEMGIAFDGDRWCIVDSTNGYVGDSISEQDSRIDYIIFSSGGMTFDIRSTEGVYLGAVGYDHNDMKSKQSITIPSFVQGVYYTALSLLSKDVVVKGTVGTSAETICKEKFKNISYSGNEFFADNKIRENEKEAEEKRPEEKAPQENLSEENQTYKFTKGTVFTSGNICYRVTKNATSVKRATVSCVGCTGNVKGNVNIPARIKEAGETFEVTEIEEKAFQGNRRITKVTIDKGVFEIGEYAFAGCSKLKSFTIGSSVTKIGFQAFKGDRELKTLKVKTKKLTGKNIKKALEGSSIKTIKLFNSAVGQKTYYKKIFKKSNSGKKVKIK